MVAHFSGGEGVGGSNPLAPTIKDLFYMIAIDLKTLNKCFRARITLRKNRDKSKKIKIWGNL